MNSQSYDPHSQLRALYRSLLERQSNFDEFKQLLGLYPASSTESAEESDEASQIREHLNSRIRAWLGGEFEGLSVVQLLQWRAIVVEERFNVVLSPWKESNWY
jgi:hypothetical protein